MSPRIRSAASSVVLLVLGALAPGACSDPAAEPPGETTGRACQALGEPQDGFPSWAERVVFVLTNRACCDPVAEIADVCPTTCTGTYSPVSPVLWYHDASRAARFQAASPRNHEGRGHRFTTTLKPP